VSSEDLVDHGRRIAELERKVSELYKRIAQAEPKFGGRSGFASDPPASVAALEDPRLATLLESGDKIAAIKLYRELTGASLAEAKDAVESM
jgi:ribosomal protein L7/L12